MGFSSLMCINIGGIVIPILRRSQVSFKCLFSSEMPLTITYNNYVPSIYLPIHTASSRGSFHLKPRSDLLTIDHSGFYQVSKHFPFLYIYVSLILKSLLQFYCLYCPFLHCYNKTPEAR